MESNSAQSPSRFQAVENLREEMLQGIQFTIHRQTQGLKGSGRRMYPETVPGLWDYSPDLFRKFKSVHKA
jgi:hypothetical protein